jgi:hypothetical protein
MTVLTAKLFAALAGMIFFFAFLGREQVLRHQNLSINIGHTVLGPYYSVSGERTTSCGVGANFSERCRALFWPSLILALLDGCGILPTNPLAS